MQKISQECYKSKSFRDNLWSEVSTTCVDSQWCYSYAERRMFYILFGITAVLGLLYFSGFTNEIASIYKSSKELQAQNSQNLQKAAKEKQTLTPEVNTGQ